MCSGCSWPMGSSFLRELGNASHLDPVNVGCNSVFHLRMHGSPKYMYGPHATLTLEKADLRLDGKGEKMRNFW